MPLLFLSICLTVTLVFVPLESSGQDPAKDLIREGRKVFQRECAICHGRDARGATIGKSLVDKRAFDLSDDNMRAVVSAGRPLKGMAAFGNVLKQDEVAAVVAYVRDVQRKKGTPDPTAPAFVLGDPEESLEELLARSDWRLGKAIFERKGSCLTCHDLEGNVAAVGPDLRGIASRRTPEEIFHALRRPSDTIAPGFEAKRAITSDGRSFVAQPGEVADGKIELFDPHAGYWARYHLGRLEHLSDSERSVMGENYVVRMLSYEDIGAICAYLLRLE